MESDWSLNVWKLGLTQLGYTKAARLLVPTWLAVGGIPSGGGTHFFFWQVPGDNQPEVYVPFTNLLISATHFPWVFEVEPDTHW